ncbi:hypothetical protein GGD81_000850 [Rhodobium orientis]|nr:hypothetical protein [Rhodobium orientis]
MPSGLFKAQQTPFGIDEGTDPGGRAATGLSHARIGSPPF